MKYLTSSLLLFSLVTMPLAKAEDPILDRDTFYTEEENGLFNRGRFVGRENDDALRALRRERNKNWAIAIGSSALGMIALVLVSD